jgi:hypothetical protein
VEYIFKNTASQKPQTILLSELTMHVQSALREKTISYTSVLSVRLTKSNDFYKTTIALDNDRPIEITNRFYHPDGSFEDRSRQYETFIRVLHFHLQEKSSAQFCTGCSWGKLILAGIATMAISFVLSLALYFLKINFIDLVAQSFLIAALFMGFLLAAFWPLFPTYIPSQFLP